MAERTDKIVMLVTRSPNWPQDYGSNLIQWVREGEPMTITFTPEQIKELASAGMIFRFDLRDVKP